MMAPQSGRFASNYLRCIYGIPFALFGLLGLSAAATGSGGIAFGVPFALLCWFLAVRGLRMGVYYSPDGVVVRGFVRTRKWPWSDVASFAVNVGPVGAMAYRRRVFTVTLTTGQTMAFKDQNASPRETLAPSWVDSAVKGLNRELAERS
jgi:hypothetical protein